MGKKKVTKDLYSNICAELANTGKYKELLHDYSMASKEFDKGLSEEQKKQFLELSDLAVDMNEELNFQIFVEGLGLGIKIVNEVYYKEDGR